MWQVQSSAVSSPSCSASRMLYFFSLSLFQPFLDPIVVLCEKRGLAELGLGALSLFSQA
jgi:hypothetical protein